MKRILVSMLAMTVAAPVLAGSHASGDAEEGEKAFRKCKACHMIETADGETIVRGGQVGPNLWNMVTRKPGALEGYSYGDDLAKVGEMMDSNWTEEEFVAYVANPTEWLEEKLDTDSARSKMAFRLGDEEEARDIWTYIASVSPEPEQMTN